MNIVQVSPYSLARNGGVQKHVRDLSSEFRKLGHNVMAIGPGSGTPAPEGTINIGAMRPISFAGTHFELARATKQELADLDQKLAAFKPDIIHYHTMWTPLLPFQIFQTDAAHCVFRYLSRYDFARCFRRRAQGHFPAAEPLPAQPA